MTKFYVETDDGESEVEATRMEVAGNGTLAFMDDKRGAMVAVFAPGHWNSACDSVESDPE